MNEQIYNKYSQNQSMYLSVDEILNDFSMIKPTFNPILDICIIKTLGNYIYNITNFKKWEICPNLINEIINIKDNKSMQYNLPNNSTDIFYNINNQDIIDIITKASSKYEQPIYTINKVYYFVSDYIKEHLDIKNSDDIDKYFTIKAKYNEYLDIIKLNYTDTWNEIDIIYEKISNILFENFTELENDLNFEKTINIIDSIGIEANKKIQHLINSTALLIKDNIISPQLKLDFDKNIDQIYEQIISSKKFDKLIHDVIVDMYGVEKSIHRMSLTLEHCSHVVNTLLDKPFMNEMDFDTSINKKECSLKPIFTKNIKY